MGGGVPSGFCDPSGEQWIYAGGLCGYCETVPRAGGISFPSCIYIAEKVVVPLSPKKHWTPSP